MTSPQATHFWLLIWALLACCTPFRASHQAWASSSHAKAGSSYTSKPAGDLSNIKSSVQCVSEPGNPLYQMCTYHNILVYGLDVIYLSDEPVELPKFDVTWLEIGDEYKLMHVKVMSPAELALPANVQVEPVNQAAFWFFGTADNYGHCLGEYAPTLHNLICKALGLCTYDPAADLRIFRLNQAQAPGEQPFPAAIDEALQCFSPDPVLHLGHAAYNNKAFLVSKGVAGIGSECRAFHWCDEAYRRRPLSMDTMRAFQHSLGQCIGWEDSATVSQDPMRIVIFDRKLESRRAILNIDAVADAIRARHPEAELQVVYAEDMSFKQQALAAASASVFILIHGASLANFLFLPQGSVGIHIVGDPGYAGLHQWIQDFVRDLPQAPHLLEMTNADPWRMHLVPSAILHDDIYQQLSEQQKRDFWATKDCPAEPQAAADRCRHVWLVKQMNLDIDVSQLMDFVNKGVSLVLGFEPPAHVPIGQASPQTGKLTSSGSTPPGKASSQLPGLSSDDQQYTLLSTEPRLVSSQDPLHKGSASRQGNETSVQPLSSKSAANESSLDGLAHQAQQPSPASKSMLTGAKGLKDGIAEDEEAAAPSSVPGKVLGHAAHGAGARKPLGHRHAASSHSASSFRVHKRRLIRRG